jgi:hypothetical protein
MIKTIDEILKSFTDEIPKELAKKVKDLDPATEIIYKAPRQMIPFRFEEGEPAALVVMSDLRKDRDQEVLLPEGLDDTTYSGVVLYNHDYWHRDIPHARSLYRQKNPENNPYEIFTKILYLTGLSELGRNVYEYRKAGHPLGISHGFRTFEWLSKGQSGYDAMYKDWVKRCRSMLKKKSLKAAPGEFEEPRRFAMSWEIWEISETFVGSNPDALAEAVNKGIVTPEMAKELVEFKPEAEQKQDDKYELLKKRIADLEAEIEEYRKDNKELSTTELARLWNEIPPVKSLEEIWASIE